MPTNDKDEEQERKVKENSLGPIPRSRIESLSNLIFGLALSVGAISLIKLNEFRSNLLIFAPRRIDDSCCSKFGYGLGSSRSDLLFSEDSFSNALRASWERLEECDGRTYSPMRRFHLSDIRAYVSSLLSSLFLS
jgi:hypothetical protein